MSRSDKRRIGLAVVVSVLLASTLTACTVSAAGGVIGGAGAIAFAVFLLAGSSSQSGCGPTFTACLSPVYVPPDDAGPGELTDAGPIESVAPATDAGLAAIDGGPELTPCLKIAMPDAGTTADAYVDLGPCLEVRPCLDVTPCLKPPPHELCLSLDPFGADLAPIEPPARERTDSLERLADRLPPDVVERLREDE